MHALIGFQASASPRARPDDSARAAIAFGTAFLRAGQPPFVAQELQQRRLRRKAGDVDAFAVQQEADRLAHIRTYLCTATIAQRQRARRRSREAVQSHAKLAFAC